MGEYAICGILGREEGSKIALFEPFFESTKLVFRFYCSLLYVVYTCIDIDNTVQDVDSYVYKYSNSLLNI